MRYLILESDKYNGLRKGAMILFIWEILSGKHKGKYCTDETSLNEFPEIFENEPYEVVDLDPKAFQIDYTPPTMSGNLVAIPPQYKWVFRNERFELNGFVVEFIRTPDNELMVDVAYLRWQAFQYELDKPENATVKNSLEPVWDYILEQANKENFL